MPKTKKITPKKRTQKVHEMIDTKTEQLLPADTLPSYASDMNEKSTRTKWIVLGVALILALAVYAGMKGYIVAAMVDGMPIFRWDVSRALVARFGQQTLESMISESLITSAAQKNGVVITGEEVEAKMNELVKTLGPNVNIDDLLKYQGMTRKDFEHQVRLQLTVEKILGKDVAIQDSDVEAFIAENKTMMTATEEASLREEARQTLMSQKISEKIQPWFAELKEKAAIVRLMK